MRNGEARFVHFTYGTSGSDADNLNRLDAIQDDNSGAPGTTLASYTYLGAEGSGTVVEIDYEEPALREEKLYLIGSGNSYAGFDRFMRIVDQRWHDYGGPADVDRYKYAYDRVSNRLYRENTVTAGKDEFYTYLCMCQLARRDIFEKGHVIVRDGGELTGRSRRPVAVPRQGLCLCRG